MGKSGKGNPIVSTIKKIFEDSLQDWVRSLAFGAISAVALGIATLALDRLPLEFRQHAYIAVAALLSGLFTTFIYLLFKQKQYAAKGFALLCIVALLFITYHLVDGYIYKNLRHMDEAFVAVFYPEPENPAQAVVIEREMRNLPNRISKDGKSVRLEKIATGFSGGINNSLLGRYLNRSPRTAGYLEIIPDGGKYFLKVTMPLTIPYKSLGFNSLDIENVTYENSNSGAPFTREDYVELTASHHSLKMNASLGVMYSNAHYGIDSGFVRLGFYMTGEKGKDAFNDSLVNPLGGGFPVKEDNLSGAVFFASSYILGSYYQLQGSADARCDFIESYFDYENAEMLGSHVSLLSDDDINCLSKSVNSMIGNIYPHLSETQVNLLKDATFRNALNGDTNSSAVAKAGKITPRTLETIAGIGNSCALQPGRQYSQMDENCLYGYLHDLKTPLMESPDAWAFLKNELWTTHSLRLLDGIYADEEYIFNRANTIALQFRSLDDTELVCEIDWAYAFAGSFMQHRAHIKNAGDAVALITDRSALLAQITACEEVYFFGLDLKKLLLSPEGGRLTGELALYIDESIAADVSVGSFLQGLNRRFRALARFMEFDGMEDYLAHIGNLDFNSLSDLAAESVSYFLRDFNNGASEDELHKVATGFFREKFSHISLDVPVSKLSEISLFGEQTEAEGISGRVTNKLMELMESYFSDPVTTQVFLSLRSDGREIIQGPLKNSFMDKMLMYRIASKEIGDAGQLKDALEQLEQNYPEVEQEPAYKHYQFVYQLLSGNIEEAASLSGELLAWEAGPKRTFYEYATALMRDDRKFRQCAGVQDYPSYILKHLVTVDFKHEIWLAAAGSPDVDTGDYLTAINGYLHGYAAIPENEFGDSFRDAVVQCGELALAETEDLATAAAQ